jgi:hypothetical protein
MFLQASQNDTKYTYIQSRPEQTIESNVLRFAIE